MQDIRLWRITPDQRLDEIKSNPISREARLEEWLKSDIGALAPNLLVIGRQVPTDFGGTIDLLCLDSAGDTVVVELKKGKTPREVTAQALDYASWVKGLSTEQLVEIADKHFESPGLLPVRFQTNAIKVLMQKASIWNYVGLAAVVRFKEQLGGVESESVKQ